LDQELKNKEKRKNASLSTSEWLTFFFVPFNFGPRQLQTKDFNKIEEGRFINFGFEKKLKQYRTARFYGTLFYLLIFVVFIFLID
jgi:hypothetical protein